MAELNPVDRQFYRARWRRRRAKRGQAARVWGRERFCFVVTLGGGRLDRHTAREASHMARDHCGSRRV
mgnify:CR=1 FL=1